MVRRWVMAKQLGNYTREFKAEAVRRIAEKGKSLAEVARALGLGECLLRSWKQALAEVHRKPSERVNPRKVQDTPGRVIRDRVVADIVVRSF
jgi:transposase-like protein